jgi:hypothetical protein
MRHRCSLLPILLLVALFSLVAMASHAARPAAVSEPLLGTPQRFVVGTPQEMYVVCQLGVTRPGAYLVDYLYPPNDAYFTLLVPENCACPGPNGVLLSNAHALLNFQMACSIPVSVGVVAADLTDPLCPVPVPGQYICAPVNYNLAPAAAGNYNFAFALPSGCCITQKAFLVITFTGAGTCTTLPRLITTDGCDPCVSYNVYPAGFDDLCADIGFPGNPNMYVEAACCDIVPALRGTWGRVKTLYR